MRPYTQQLAMDFWFAFDNYFMWKISPTVRQQLSDLTTGGEGFMYSEMYTSIQDGTFPTAYLEAVRPKASVLNSIFQEQENILKQSFGNSEINQQRAFEDFGQGILFDVRRATPQYQFWAVHSMDANYSAQQPPIGYYTWYSFLRAYTLLNGITDGYWLSLGRHIALGAVIQEFMKPRDITGGVHTNPNNPTISESKLAEFRSRYLAMDFNGLDRAFTSDDALGPRPLPSRFASMHK